MLWDVLKKLWAGFVKLWNCACCPPRTLFIVRVVYACVGIVLGLIICAVFNVAFPNKYTAYFGLSSAILAAVCLVEYVYVYWWTELQQRPAHLLLIIVFALIGAVGISVGLGATVTFLGLGITDTINHRDISLPRSYYLASVWAFANFKWGYVAFRHALRTLRKLMKGQSHTDQTDGDGAALIPGGEAINDPADV